MAGLGAARPAVLAVPSAREWYWWAWPTLILGTLAWWLTQHFWSDPSNVLPLENPNDATQFSWFLAWTPSALEHGSNPLHADLINHPGGINLMWNTAMPGVGVLFWPITAVFGSAWLVTFLIAAGPFLSGLSATFVGRRIGLSPTAATLGGAFYAFSPAMTAKSVGHINLTMEPLIPLMLFVGLKMATDRDRLPVRYSLSLSALAAGQLLINEELLVLTGLTLLLLLISLAVSVPRASWPSAEHIVRRYAVALLAFAIVAGPLLAYQLLAPGHGSGSIFTTSYFKADLASYVVPSKLQLLSSTAAQHRSSTFTGGITEQTAFLGWPMLLVLVVILVAMWKDVSIRCLLVVSAVLSLFALGGVLAIDGSDSSLKLPWHVVSKIPMMDNLLASRLPLLTDLLIAAALALALDRIVRIRSVLRPTAVAGLAILFLTVAPAPLQVMAAPPTPEFFQRHNDAAFSHQRSILVLPFPTGTETRPMRWQVQSGMRFSMPGGFFIGPADDGHLYIGGQPRGTQVMLINAATSGQSPKVDEQVRGQFRTDMSFWRARTVVLDPSAAPANLPGLVTALVGAPPRETGGVLVWTLS